MVPKEVSEHSYERAKGVKGGVRASKRCQRRCRGAQTVSRGGRSLRTASKTTWKAVNSADLEVFLKSAVPCGG
jgi:hypothetical protein